MQIDISQIRITSIKHNGCIIHFEYDGEHYFLQTGSANGDYTLITSLFKKVNATQNEKITSCYGGYARILQGHFKNKTITLVNKYELEGLVSFINSSLKETR